MHLFTRIFLAMWATDTLLTGLAEARVSRGCRTNNKYVDLHWIVRRRGSGKRLGDVVYCRSSWNNVRETIRKTEASIPDEYRPLLEEK